MTKPVITTHAFSQIADRIRSADLVGLLLAQHNLEKLLSLVRPRLKEDAKPKHDKQAELPLPAHKSLAAVVKPARPAKPKK